jgi:NADH dehydrogenase FAD-containing subunit
MNTSNKGTVIVGGGQAAAELASALRTEGYQLPVRIVSNETHLPYQRPPLSKKFLIGDVAAHSLALRSEQFFGRKVTGRFRSCCFASRIQRKTTRSLIGRRSASFT